MLTSQVSSKIFLAGLFLLAFFLTAFGAAGDVDLSFNAHPSKDSIFTGVASSVSFIGQPDGKILVYGGFRVVNGAAVNRLVRLNPDGSLDPTFECSECNKFFMSNAMLLPDGKILVAGSFQSGLTSKSKTIRLNPDGSLDGSFAVQLPENLEATNYGTVLINRQLDGKIYIGHNAQFTGQTGVTVYRLNPNGSVDTGFTSFFTNTRLGRGFVSGITPLPDGRLYVYGATAFGALTRLNADGSEDATFEKPVFTNDVFQIPPSVQDITVQADGKVVIVGTFVTVNGLSKTNFTRLHSGGSVDLTFADATGTSSPPLEEYPDGKLLVSKRVDIAGYYLPVRLNPDGTPAAPLDLPANLVTVNNFKITVADRIYISGVFNENGRWLNKIARLNADGTLDPTFGATIALRGIVQALALQPDGKVVMSGDFERVNGVLTPNIVRVNPDGSLDPSFDGGTGFNSPPRGAAVDAQGNILAFGDFASYDGTPRQFFARLLPNGALDSGFTPALDGSIYALALQPDGKLLIGGLFTSVNGQAVKRIARLNPDGTFDGTFNPLFGSVGQITGIFVQPDGKIMVGGSFLGVDGFNRQNLVRLNADGSLDGAFNAGAIGFVRQVAQISNGKYLTATTRIVRLNSDGTRDDAHVSPEFGHTSSSSIALRFLVLPGDGVIVTGDYNLVDNVSRRGVVALFPNGRLAGQTYPRGANGPAYDIVRQTDGKIIVGGDFDLIEDVARAGVARLAPPVLSKKIFFDYDGDGRADVSVFRPSENKWYVLRSSDNAVVQQIFAVAGDIPVPADYDGDGRTDLAIFRPSTGDWWYLSSQSGAQISVHWGQAGDLPRPSDFDGDGKTDFVVYRPSNGIWYRLSAIGQFSSPAFGAAGDISLVGDFDGDGRSDPAVFRPSTGDWWYAASSQGGQHRAVHWGASGDIPVPGDYDGDGKTDFVVFRPSDGGWYILYSTASYTIATFGTIGDRPVAADYDGDGRADIGVFRPSTGIWYLLQTTSGFGAVQWGVATDVPTESAFLP